MEGADDIRQVAESDVERDARDRVRFVGQQPRRPADATPNQVLKRASSWCASSNERLPERHTQRRPRRSRGLKDVMACGLFPELDESQLGHVQVHVK
jgi:hypothetical protein